MEPKLGGNRIGDNLRRFDVLLHLDDFIFQIKIWGNIAVILKRQLGADG